MKPPNNEKMAFKFLHAIADLKEQAQNGDINLIDELVSAGQILKKQLSTLAELSDHCLNKSGEEREVEHFNKLGKTVHEITVKATDVTDIYNNPQFTWVYYDDFTEGINKLLNTQEVIEKALLRVSDDEKMIPAHFVAVHQTYNTVLNCFRNVITELTYSFVVFGALRDIKGE